MEKAEISGLIILFIGVALLLFTFLNAYWFLTREIGLISTGDLVEAFGESLAPLIATCIRIMYLGIMMDRLSAYAERNFAFETKRVAFTSEGREENSAKINASPT